MAASDVPPGYSHDAEKSSKATPLDTMNEEVVQQNVFGDETHRRLKGRHIQLIGIGGTIGTVLFVCPNFTPST
jgi:amino acid transporter